LKVNYFDTTSAFGKIQGERYGRTKNLWTVENEGLGFSVDHFSNEAKEPIPSGSWARYDRIDFEGLGIGGVVVRAKSEFSGAKISFRSGSPDGDVLFEVSVGNEGDGYQLYESSAESASAAMTWATIFMVFESIDGGVIGATVDWFKFTTSSKEQ